MNKWLKRSGIVLVLLILTAVVGGAIFLLNFDPKVYQDRLVKEIKLRYERDLKINGEIELSLFPRIGLRVTDVSLSNKNAETEFSSMQEVRFAVALWPLLFDRFLVDHVKVNGFKSHIVRYADGSLNIDDFYALPLDFDKEHMARRRQQAAAEELPIAERAARMAANEFKIDIAGLDLENGTVLVEDQASKRQFSLDSMSIHTGRITFGEPFSLALNAKLDARHPTDDATLNVRSRLRFEPAASIYQVEQIDATLQGQIKGYRVAEAALNGRFSVDNFAGDAHGKALRLLLNLNALDESKRLSHIDLDVRADEVGLNRIDTQLLAKNLSIKGSTADHQKRSLAWELNSPNLNLSGFDAAAEPLTGTVQFRGEESMDVNVSLDGFSGLASNLKIRENTLKGRYLTSANRAIDIDLSSPLSINLLSGEFSYPALRGLLRLSDGDLLQEAPVIASIRGDLRSSSMDFNVDAVMDAERMNLSGTLSSFSKPSIDFKLSAESLALDHILGVDSDLPLASLMLESDAKDKSQAAATSNQTSAAAPIEAAPSTKPNKSRSLSLKQELLARLSGVGVFDIAKMSYRGLDFQDLSATLFFDSSSDIKIDALRAKFFGGELAANSQMSLDDGSLKVDLKLKDVDMASLLQGFKARALLSSRADIDLALATQGLSEKELLQNLNGQLSLDSAEGKWHGFSMKRVLDDVTHMIDTGSQQLRFEQSETTPFKRLRFAADVNQGIMHFTKLHVDSSDFSLVNKDESSQYNMLDGHFDFNLQLNAKQPVSVSRQGVNVQVKGFSIPIRLWNDAELIQVETALQEL
ncbi:AsmA family protein [Oligella urethralis]|uniref:Putative assembly protein n=1 Tax=Oligella urethralis TaxID=90245 RepID=A0A2X1UJE7_9BURK|nr:AsmA family protein [Oligella urethralis]SPY07336.1 putative assembly protein [Oligella urethralis]SUA66139.1 putative assembly protein [Oligella urethralis]